MADEFVIRRFQDSDAQSVSELIARTLRISNGKDYSPTAIEKTVAVMQPQDIISRASWTHFYVVCLEGEIIGCGAIGPYWGSTDESSLFTIFVHPSCQGRGIGTRIIRTLELDDFFLRARRIEIPASITACPFYQKMGYSYKDDIREPDKEGLLRLEKYRRIGAQSEKA